MKWKYCLNNINLIHSHLCNPCNPCPKMEIPILLNYFFPKQILPGAPFDDVPGEIYIKVSIKMISQRVQIRHTGPPIELRAGPIWYPEHTEITGFRPAPE